MYIDQPTFLLFAHSKINVHWYDNYNDDVFWLFSQVSSLAWTVNSHITGHIYAL